SDVYSTGVVLYRALVGKLPFGGRVFAEVLKKVLEDEPVAPRKVNPKIALDLETITLRCLAKEPARRYPSAKALADDLARFLEGEPILARPVGRLERAGRWLARNRKLAAALALAPV